MRNLVYCCLLAASAFAASAAPEKPLTVTSPDGKITVNVQLDSQGQARYTITRDRKTVLESSALGVVREDADFSRGLKLLSVSKPERVKDKYEILTSKRRENVYVANRQVVHLQNSEAKPIDLVFQVSDDGVAYRYVFPNTSPTVHRIKEEVSSFHFPAGAVAWLQPMAEAKSGWSQTNPSYEEYYQKEIAVGTPSPGKAGWVFPALFRTGDTWVVITETGLDRSYSGGRLRAESPAGEYKLGFADPLEVFTNGGHLPESTLPWNTPWRVIALGSLKQVAESNLGVHLATPPAKNAFAAQPGKASWSWPLLGDPNTTLDVQKRFVDYAAAMRWGYTLVDAEWDRQIGYEKMKELVEYGKTRGVKILVWYNSAGGWNAAPQTPRDRLLTKATRTAEFQKLKDMGVAGLKVDFFGGDGRSMIEYYHDLLEETARYGFAMNFHGCTLPRGWQRTYPHLMTMEAIRGLEFATFEQPNADEVPNHAAMLPFTRNIFDPMDFTPTVLHRLPKTTRSTTAAFELALSVLFVSGIQHYAEIPEGMDRAPDYVRSFLRDVPSVWDDVNFIEGYPGQHVVLARRGGKKWYVAGINGMATEKVVTVDLAAVGSAKTANIIRDGSDPLGFAQEKIDLKMQKTVKLSVPAHGGFVIVLE